MALSPTNFEIFSSVCFGLAILHTFLVKVFQRLSHRFERGSAGEQISHLLGEVEIVFGFWSAIFLLGYAAMKSPATTIEYLNSRNFTEPVFVFVIMTLCATKPILNLATKLISLFSKSLPFKASQSFYLSVMILGPLLGSFITEPAAMTVTAIVLLKTFFERDMSTSFKYASLGLLFVNISIGGTLTPYAAPPILMVAPVWKWDLAYMLLNFGWKGATAVVLSSSLVGFVFRHELSRLSLKPQDSANEKIPKWISIAHLLFVAAIVAASHHLSLFMGLFCFYLGIYKISFRYQSPLKLRESLLVAFFLAGLIVLGGPQAWWLSPLLSDLSTSSLYLGAMSLTAFMDNAAITYLGSLLPQLSEAERFALVAGSVVGGGLTVIANAPNPAGYGILNPSFGKDGIDPLRLFLYALPPTIVAGICFWIL